jgi:hypothetical protein
VGYVIETRLVGADAAPPEVRAIFGEAPAPEFIAIEVQCLSVSSPATTPTALDCLDLR